MFAAIRQAWQNYLASIPSPDEPERIPDRKIIQEHFQSAPVPADIRAAFDALSDLVVSHLPEQTAAKQAKRLSAKLKPAETATDALAAWIHSSCGPRSNIGVMGLDWRAREEVSWQAKILAKAHDISLAWDYDVDGDVEWKRWQELNECPVDTPLRNLSQALLKHGVVLYRFGVDTSIYGFAVSRDNHDAVSAHCAFLGIDVTCEIHSGA